MNVLEALNWRYAVRQFSAKRLDENKVEKLLAATRLSATAYGLQPYRMIMVEDMAIRQQLLPYSYGQDKVVDCSHLVVFAAQTDIADQDIDKYIATTANARGLPVEQLAGLGEHMKSVFHGMSATQKKEWAHQQVHIALGTMLTAAAMMEIDSCPMGGLEHDSYDKVLGLNELGLTTSVICALGIRHPADINSRLKKVRYAEAEMVIKV